MHESGPTPSAGKMSGAGRSLNSTLSPAAGPALILNLPPELATHPQFEILRELGRGGMGVVYLARNRLLDRLEVLKVVNRALLDQSGTMERFLREIRAAAKLSHPNVVQAYSALQLGEVLVLAMEHVDGTDLSQLVKARGRLEVVQACHYSRQAALGLQHAFEREMVHRDIKPSNLMMAREGRKHVVKVLDFGLAKATRERGVDKELTGTGIMLGTPHYVAPEQARDAASADIRADIYSLGCTLYYLLTGGPPFNGPTMLDILVAHQSTEAKRVDTVRAEVPEALAAVIARMMAKDPCQRYACPEEVARELQLFCQPGQYRATPASNPVATEISAPTHGTLVDAKTGRNEEVSLPPAPNPQPAPAVPATVLGPIPSGGMGSLPTTKARPASFISALKRRPMLIAVGAGMATLALLAWLVVSAISRQNRTVQTNSVAGMEEQDSDRPKPKPRQRQQPVPSALERTKAPARAVALPKEVANLQIHRTRGEAGVRALCQALKGGSKETRLEALAVLGDMGVDARTAVDDLADEMPDDDPSLRAGVLATMGKIGPEAHKALAVLLENLDDADERVRAASRGAIEKVGPAGKDDLSALTAALKRPNSAACVFALNAVDRLGGDAWLARSAVSDILVNSSDPQIRAHAANVLGKIGGDPRLVVADLVQAFKDKDESVRATVVRNLARLLTEASAVAGLLEALNDQNEAVARVAAEALGRVADFSADDLAPMTAVLNSGTPSARLFVAQALPKLGPNARKTVKPLADALKNGDLALKIACATALGKIGRDAYAAGPALASALHESDTHLRTSAVRALGDIGWTKQEIGTAVVRALKDASIHDEAERALVKNGKEAVKDLVIAVRDLKDYELRKLAIEVLGKIGPDAADAEEALLELDHPTLRDLAQEALKNIKAKKRLKKIKG